MILANPEQAGFGVHESFWANGLLPFGMAFAEKLPPNRSGYRA
jgi:hypothetical protein